MNESLNTVRLNIVVLSEIKKKGEVIQFGIFAFFFWFLLEKSISKAELLWVDGRDPDLCGLVGALSSLWCGLLLV